MKEIKEDNNDKKKEKDEWVSSIIIAVIAALIIRIFIFAPTVVKGSSMYPTLHDELPDSMYDNDRLIAERLSYFLNKKPARGSIVTFTEPHSVFYTEKNPLRKTIYFFTKKEYIKRVIGVEGDHVQLRGDTIEVDGFRYDNYEIKNDRIFLNGELLEGNHTAVMENASVYINGEKLEENYTNGSWSVNLNIDNGCITPSVYFNGIYGNEDINVDVIVPKGYIYVMGDNRNNSSDSRKFSDEKKDYAAKNGCISLKELSGKVVFRFWPFDRFGKLNKQQGE